ncbi:MAG: hypothetical protein ORN98_07845 [Alphaproteobacteria bacterium]|nr:hypothetical protein [Alphaproteobacteria bacterium]
MMHAFYDNNAKAEFIWDDERGVITCAANPKLATDLMDDMRQAFKEGEIGATPDLPTVITIKRDPLFNIPEFLAVLGQGSVMAQNWYVLPPELKWKMADSVIEYLQPETDENGKELIY